MKKVLTVLGTRPEAIKLAPILIEMGKFSDLQSRVCVTAQHRQMMDQVLKLFSISPDVDLNLMTPGQSLAEITSRVVSGVDQVLVQEKPDIVLIQGDTTTVMAVALAAFYRQAKVGHIEAGLRSGNLHSPFPEEMNRRVAGIISTLHFAPTNTAFQALLLEGIPEEQVFLTGNTVIDSLNMIVAQPIPEEASSLLSKAGIYGNEGELKLLLVTAHRRENFGERLESICRGLRSVVQRNRDVVVIYPVHLNPNVQSPVFRILGGMGRVILTKPVEYNVLAHLMKSAYIVLTDSGGIQEEAPSLGKPVLILRTETERPEGIEAGTAKLVGPFEDRIVAETEKLLKEEAAYKRMAMAINPYGDGHAAERIVDIIRRMR